MKSDHKVTIIISIIALVGTLSTAFISNWDKIFPSNKKNTISKTNNSIIGCWNWSNGGYIQIKDNGDVINGAVHANWKVKDLLKREYLIIWPPIIDSLTLTKNGASLRGMNTFGSQISADRIEGKSTELVGKWKWNSGLPVIIKPDGEVSLLIFKGKWSKVKNTWLIKWPVDDNIFMSKNGQKLSITNQFGSVTATRDINCGI